MMIQKEVSLVSNYHFNIASEEVIWRLLMLQLWWLLSDYFSAWRVKEQFAKYIPSLFRSFRNGEIAWSEYLEKHVKHIEWHNIVPLVLRESLASLIVWNTVTPTFEANYFALGDDNTIATNADTTLWNETLRWTFTDRFSVLNVAYLDKYFSSAEVGWNTYLEAGVFVDWTASVDTWYLLSRIVISETMAANETLTVNASFTIS
jgi:hypothetical protein